MGPIASVDSGVWGKIVSCVHNLRWRFRERCDNVHVINA